MARPLLALTLVVTQLFSWSASPLYLCLSDDGSICVDFGPDHCKCCQHSDSEHAACGATHDACTGHDHDAAPNPSLHSGFDLADNPCDCTHIQILQPRCPTLIRSSVAPDTQRLIVCFQADANHFAAHRGVEPSSSGSALLPMRHLDSLPLSTAASAVMRC